MIVHEVQPRLILAVKCFLELCKEVIMAIKTLLWYKSCSLKILGSSINDVWTSQFLYCAALWITRWVEFNSIPSCLGFFCFVEPSLPCLDVATVSVSLQEKIWVFYSTLVWGLWGLPTFRKCFFPFFLVVVVWCCVSCDRDSIGNELIPDLLRFARSLNWDLGWGIIALPRSLGLCVWVLVDSLVSFIRWHRVCHLSSAWSELLPSSYTTENIKGLVSSALRRM